MTSLNDIPDDNRLPFSVYSVRVDFGLVQVQARVQVRVQVRRSCRCSCHLDHRRRNCSCCSIHVDPVATVATVVAVVVVVVVDCVLDWAGVPEASDVVGHDEAEAGSQLLPLHELYSYIIGYYTF